MSKNKKYDAPPPYYQNPSAPPIQLNEVDNINKSKGNVKYRTKIYNKIINNFWSKDKNKNNVRKPKYHGPVDNNPDKLVKVTVKKKYSRTGNITSESSIMSLNNYNNYDRSYLNMDKNVYVGGIEPMPVYLRKPMYNSREQYFREQKRLLANRHMDERVRLEAQRVYPDLCYY